MNENRRYLNNWHYNAALILTELETIVKNDGGSICSTFATDRKQYLITNRTLSTAIREEQERLEKLERLLKTDLKNETRKRLEKLEAIKNDPIITYYSDYLYISFALDGNYYYYSMDRNPFFDFYFAKVKIEPENKINRKYYCSNDKKEWFFDCFYSFTCSDSDRREAANLIFNMLITSNYSQTYRTKNRNSHTNIILLGEV